MVLRSQNDAILDTLLLWIKLYHKPYSKESLIYGLPLDKDQKIFSAKDPKSLFSRIAKRAGLKSTLVQKKLDEIIDLHLPMILLLKNENACILDSFNEDRTKAKIIFSEDEEGSEEWVEISTLKENYLGYGFLLKKEFSYSSTAERTLSVRPKHWFFDTLKLSLPIYKDVIIATFLVNLFVLATPLFTMNVYDRVIPNNAKETLLVFTIGILIVYILDIFLKTIRGYLLEVAAKKSDIIMSSIVFERVMDLKLNVHPPSVGSFASNLKDFDAIRGFFTSATITALVDFPFVLIFLAVIYYIGGVLVFIPIGTILLILLYVFIIKKPLEESIKSTHQASAKKNSILIETLQNIESVKSLGLLNKRQWLYEEAVGEIANKNLKTKILSSSIPNVTNFLIQLNTIFVVVGGVYLIEKFELTMGGLIAVVILTSRTLAPMGQVAALISNYEDAKDAYNILNEIIHRPREREEAKEFLQKGEFKGDITFQNVSFAYPDAKTNAIEDVSFSIKPKEKVAIIGKMGSGKSTTAKLLLKLYEPTNGKILLDGIDISQLDPAQIRTNISYVPQEVQLFYGTIKENITAAAHHPQTEELLYASKLSLTKDFIDKHPLGFDMPIGERNSGLSGGQKQSVGIARALLQNAPIMVMDEPSNAMDMQSEMELIKNLKRYIEDKTLILITQKQSMLELVDRIIVIHNSKVVLDGKKEDVLKQLGGER